MMKIYAGFLFFVLFLAGCNKPSISTPQVQTHNQLLPPADCSKIVDKKACKNARCYFLDNTCYELEKIGPINEKRTALQKELVAEYEAKKLLLNLKDKDQLNDALTYFKGQQKRIADDPELNSEKFLETLKVYMGKTFDTIIKEYENAIIALNPPKPAPKPTKETLDTLDTIEKLAQYLNGPISASEKQSTLSELVMTNKNMFAQAAQLPDANKSIFKFALFTETYNLREKLEKGSLEDIETALKELNVNSAMADLLLDAETRASVIEKIANNGKALSILQKLLDSASDTYLKTSQTRSEFSYNVRTLLSKPQNNEVKAIINLFVNKADLLNYKDFQSYIKNNNQTKKLYDALAAELTPEEIKKKIYVENDFSYDTISSFLSISKVSDELIKGDILTKMIDGNADIDSINSIIWSIQPDDSGLAQDPLVKDKLTAALVKLVNKNKDDLTPHAEIIKALIEGGADTAAITDKNLKNKVEELI